MCEGVPEGVIDGAVGIVSELVSELFKVRLNGLDGGVSNAAGIEDVSVVNGHWFGLEVSRPSLAVHPI